MKGPERHSAREPSKEEIKKIVDKAELTGALRRRKEGKKPIFDDVEILERHDKSLPLGLKGSPQAKSSPEVHPSGPKMSADEATEKLMRSFQISKEQVLERFPMIKHARPGDEFTVVTGPFSLFLKQFNSDGGPVDVILIDPRTGIPNSSS